MHPIRWLCVLLPVALSSSVLSDSRLTAQCSTQWLGSGGGIPGLDHYPRALLRHDPDGAGPLTERIVVAGQFILAGDQLANRIAAYDPTTGTWSRFGSGMNGDVFAVAELQTGELVAGGSFTMAGGQLCNGIARWNGSAWLPFGSGVTGSYFAVYALLVQPDGDLVAAGYFEMAGGSVAAGIARWDGSRWLPFGAGLPGVSELAWWNGRLVAAGNLASGRNVMMWDGITWQPLTQGMDGVVRSLVALQNGDLVAGGAFGHIGNVAARGIARYDGVSWFAMGEGSWHPVEAVAELPGGLVVAGGLIRPTGGGNYEYLGIFNGSTWQTLPTSVNATVLSLAVMANGDIVCGGSFTMAGAVAVQRVARWNGTAWQAFAAPTSIGMNNGIAVLTSMANGDLVAGGGFTTAGATAANGIARWNGVSWAPFSSGMNGWVTALAVAANGDVFAGGTFSNAGGIAAENVARWNGTIWQPVAGGIWRFVGVHPVTVNALAVLRNGDLIAAGSFDFAGAAPCGNIARLSGGSWSSIGALSNLTGNTYGKALAVQQDDSVVIGGSFLLAGNVAAANIARWDGATWSPLGAGTDGAVHAIAVLPDGNLVVGGDFSTAGTVAANHVARWDGSAWSSLGAGVNLRVGALAVLPNGDVVAAGSFTMAGGIAADRVARWNGTAWQAIGGGANNAVSALVFDDRGVLAAGGMFTGMDNRPAPYFARLATTCAATATVMPTACIGPVGPMSLVAEHPPWTGAEFRSQVTGFAPLSIGAGLLGFSSPNIPLTLHPAGLPNCFGVASSEGYALIVPVAGHGSCAWFAPNSATLAGLPLFHQVVQAEVDALGGLVSLSSSNGLALVLGSF